MSPSLGFQHHPCDTPTPSWEAEPDTLALSYESQLALPGKANAEKIVAMHPSSLPGFSEQSIYSVPTKSGCNSV